jgi:hypothetical protein
MLRRTLGSMECSPQSAWPKTPKAFESFQALGKIHKVDIIHTSDKFGSTPIDYLCVNQTPASALVIRSLLQTIFAARVQWLGLV